MYAQSLLLYHVMCLTSTFVLVKHVVLIFSLPVVVSALFSSISALSSSISTLSSSIILSALFSSISALAKSSAMQNTSQNTPQTQAFYFHSLWYCTCNGVCVYWVAM